MDCIAAFVADTVVQLYVTVLGGVEILEIG
jgi:hypothetical protein